MADVRLPDLVAELGGRRVHEDVAGALAWHVLLEDSPDAKAIARGWRGDRVQVWESDGGDALVGLVVFAEEATASRFAAGLNERRNGGWSAQSRGRRVAVLRGLDTRDATTEALFRSTVEVR